MKLKTGDKILIRRGRDRGKSGKIMQLFPERGLVVVEGLNIRKRHLRPSRRGERGQLVEFAAPFAAANAAWVCPACDKPSRIGKKLILEPTGKMKKLRVCKKCGETSG